MLRSYFRAGWEKYAEETLEKTAGHGIGIGGALFGPLAGFGADEGKGWSTAGGAFLGNMLGGAVGGGLASLTRSPWASVLAQIPAGYIGSRWGHGDYDKMKEFSLAQLFASKPR